ncbi:TPA: non-canonical purine NTP pyrophosphatase [Candidatus Woesearchaeota archaeon]|nr:non-canonical purine NTP pyrophosphatase [Candidatus Woesearchaeota archaeon]
MRIIFITGNKHKMEEAAAILHDHDVERLDIDLPEIQSLDPEEIITQKLAVARERLKTDNDVRDTIIMVEDVSFWIGDTGLPGPLIKFFNQTIGRPGLVTFAHAFGTDKARALCCIGILRPGVDTPEFFTGTIEGTVVPPRGESGFGFDPVFIPDGHTKTYAEMLGDEKNAISHRKRALEALEAFLETG